MTPTTMNARFPRSRPLPKYTDPQLDFLKSYLPEYERRSLGPTRGDAKKYALERAVEFIARFGLPESQELDPGEDPDTKFRDQLYHWFKNSAGRNRRKAEGRPRSAKKSGEKSPAKTRERDPWEQNPDFISPTLNRDYESSTSTYAENTPTLTPSPTVPARIPVQPYPLTSTLANALQPSPSPPSPQPPAHPLVITVDSLCDGFLSNVDPQILAAQIQSFVLANPAPLALKPVIIALFQAISVEWEKSKTPPNPFLTRFLSTATYFPAAIRHAGVAGPLAGACALHMHIRKAARWVPTSAVTPRHGLPAPAPASSMSLELHRITLDRARRKDHIQWARIHAAALEVGAFTIGYDGNACDYVESRAFSDLVARDALWEEDEVEWVAGILVLQALIHTSIPGDVKRRQYEELLVNYEERWKEMRDEARQAMVTEALLAAKTDLARLGP